MQVCPGPAVHLASALKPSIETREATMKKLSLLTVVPLFVIFILPACTEIPGDAIPPVFAAGWTAPVKKNMRPFESDRELAAYLRQIAEKQLRARRAVAKSGNYDAAA